MTKQKIIPVKGTEENHYIYLQIFNGFVGLTSKEMEVLAEFIKIHKEQQVSPHPRNAFSPDLKQLASKRLEMKIGTLNNYIKSLKDKKAIRPGERQGYFDIVSTLMPVGEEEVVFKLESDGESS